MRSPLLFVALAIALLHPGTVSGAGEPVAYEWLQDLSLVVLDSDDVGSLHAAHARIRAAGGTIALLSPPSLLVGWIPPAAAAALVGQAHIRAIHTRAVGPTTLGLVDDASRTMVEFFNQAVRGEIRPPATVDKPGAMPLGGDTRSPEDIETWAYLQNLEVNGLDLGKLAARDLLVGKTLPDGRIAGNSDRMTGTVTVTLLFVESDGTQSDPNTYTWTPADVQTYVNGVNTGLLWWSAEAKLRNNCWVAFFVRWVPPTDSRCAQWREMVLHPSGDVALMASDVMAKFGFNSGGHMTRVAAFNTAQRATFGTDWAYSAFVAYNPEPAPGQLTDGSAAFAYLTGPYTFLLYRSYSWRPDQVFPHESGHIFGACDEYASACSCNSICIDVLNGNCESCGGGVSCMMRANTFTMCSYTDDMVGWQDGVPCAPPVLVPPTAQSITPAEGAQGTTVQVSITGQNLLYGAYAEFGSGVSVQSSSVVGNTLQMVLVIDNDAATGTRSVIVSNRDLQSSTLVNAFTVRPTTRHYYAPAGSNVFPYHTPATAANVLANAIAAAAPGDTVLVNSGTLPISALVLNKGILLSGAWNAGFTARDLVNGKTLVELTGNVFIAVSGAGTGGLDGFRLRHGHGAAWSTPISGNYGGAVSIVSSTGAVLNCDIDANQAAMGGGFGGGGGIFAANSAVTLAGNTIHDNTATRGGGIYLYASSGTLTANTITNNTVSPSAVAARGAGIVLDGCTNVTLVDNTLDGNGGAEVGGGLYVVNSTGIDVQGGLVTRHTVSSSGGGARVEAATVAFRGVRLARNTSSLTEGGLAATSASTVQVDDCEFLWNTAFIYAGMNASNSAAFVRHSLFVGNNAVVGGGLAFGTVGSGAVLGNTFDRNTAPNGGACVQLSDAPVQVTNNILANSTGTAVACTGTLPTLLDYNVAWNSSVAHYSGGVPGPGSRLGDPRFADTTQVNYRLGLHSAAIDAGRTDVGFADPDGSRGDCGRYGSHAFVMQQPSAPQGLVVDHQAGHVLLRWHRNPELDVTGYAVYCDTTIGFRPGPANFSLLVASPDTTADLGPIGACTVFTVGAVDASGYASGYAAPAVLSTTDTPALDSVWEFRLRPTTPNPFNPTAMIQFELDRAAPLRLEIYDSAGHRVRTLASGAWPAGGHRIVWDGRDGRGARLASGVYLLRLESQGRSRTQKLTLLE